MRSPQTLRLVALLLASTAMGQAKAPALSPTTGVTRAEAFTTAALTLYVDSTGNDSNACTSTGTGACLTFQGAYGKVPRRIRHPVTIEGAAGTFAGLIIDNPEFDTSQTAYLLVKGTRIAATPATGTASGTATGGTAGSGITYGTLLDSGAAWTVNDLRGQFIRIVSGTGVGQIKVISSNTATAITITGTWTAPVNGSVYAIETTGTTLTGTTLPPTYQTTTSGNGSPVTVTGPNFSIRGTGNLTIEDLATTSASLISGINTSSPNTLGVSRVRVLAGQCLTAQPGSNTAVTDSYCAQTAGNFGFFTIRPFRLAVNNSVISGGATAIYGGSTGGANHVNTNSNLFLNQTTIAWDMAGVNGGFSTNDTFSGPGSGIGIGNGVASTNPLTSTLRVSGSSISNYATAISVPASGSFVFLSAAVGSGSTVGISIAKGGKVQATSSTTTTGTTEAIVDGTNTDYATMRSNSPKIVPTTASPYGSAFYE
jgi:hypothetical protein